MKTVRGVSKLIGGLVGLAIAGLAGSANAAIILSHDSAFDFLGAPQDGQNITVDLDNGLEWLDWTLTTSGSFNTVSALLGPGNPLEGWRYATADEFNGLLLAGGISPADIDVRQLGPDPSEVLSVFSALGMTSGTRSIAAFDVPGQSFGTIRLGGFLSANDSACTRGRFVVDVPNDPTICYVQNWGPTYGNSTVGVALVRDALAVVPEPSSVALFLVALGGLGFMARRRAA